MACPPLRLLETLGEGSHPSRIFIHNQRTIVLLCNEGVLTCILIHSKTRPTSMWISQLWTDSQYTPDEMRSGQYSLLSSHQLHSLALGTALAGS